MRSHAYLYLTAAVMTAALALWAGAAILSAGSLPAAAPSEAPAALRQELLIRGSVLRDETPVYAEGEVIVLPRDGQWVSGGEIIAVTPETARACFDLINCRAADSSDGTASGVFAPSDAVTAPCAGYFTRYVEGLGDTENVIGKIVSGNGWCFFAEPDKKTLKMLGSAEAAVLDGHEASVIKLTDSQVMFRIDSGVRFHLCENEAEMTLTLEYGRT